MFNNIRKHAFTLAEVLVTLGIIGVVSAMTIPSLTQSWQKQAYVAQLKKTYSQIAQAAMHAINENDASSLGETKYSYNNANSTSNFLKDNFKVVQDCGHSWTPCFASSYKNIYGQNLYNYLPSDCAAVTTADGVAIAAYYNGISYDVDGYHTWMDISVDINGKKGPNIAGRDLFHMELYDDGTVTETYDPSSKKHNYNLTKDGCIENTGFYGIGCLTVIMNNGWVMDY